MLYVAATDFARLALRPVLRERRRENDLLTGRQCMQEARGRFVESDDEHATTGASIVTVRLERRLFGTVGVTLCGRGTVPLVAGVFGHHLDTKLGEHWRIQANVLCLTIKEDAGQRPFRGARRCP